MTEILSFLPHTAAVHTPLALAVLFPIFYLVSWWSITKKLMPDRLWVGVWALSIIQLISIIGALISGENAEFLSAGSQAQVEQHEELAKVFSVTWVVIFLLLSLGLWNSKLRNAYIHIAVIALLLGQFILALWTGHVGGGLAAR